MLFRSVLTREFRIEESTLTMPDVSLMIQSGYTPRKEWIERHFRVELEEKKEGEGAQEESTTYDPQKDQDLMGSIFGGATPEGGGTTPEGGGNQPTPEQDQAAAADLNAAAETMDTPEGATPEESQADAIQDEYSLEDLMGDEENGGEEKPFGDEGITEDEATQMTK